MTGEPGLEVVSITDPGTTDARLSACPVEQPSLIL